MGVTIAPNNDAPLGRARPPAPSETSSAKSQAGGFCSFGPRLSEDEMLNDTVWCAYCCCAGCGVASCWQLRPCQCAYHCLCCSQVCESTACWGAGGPCKVMSDCLCCELLCQCPSRPGRPRCICCTTGCCGKVGGKSNASDAGEDFEFDYVLESAGGTTPCFCCCCGSTCCLREKPSLFSPSPISGAEAFAQHLYKCCCCESRCSCTGLRCCAAVCSAWCCLSYCRLPAPPTPPNPCCALCSFRFKYARAAAPKQQEMN